MKKSNCRQGVTLKLCHMIEECFQRGFGDRLSVSFAGPNCYFGNHHSSRLKKDQKPKMENVKMTFMQDIAIHARRIYHSVRSLLQYRQH